MISNEQLPAPDEEGKSELRKGFALVTALLALVVVGALVTGSFFAASQEREMGLSARYNDDGMYVAENALNRVAADNPKSFWQGVTSSREMPDSVIVTAGGTTIGTARVWVRPTGSGYFLVARGASARGGRVSGGGRTLGMVLRLLNISFPPGTAMQVFGSISVKGSAQVSGKDVVPSSGAQWDTCNVRTGTDTAIIAQNSGLVDGQKSNSIIGPVVQHPMDSTSFLKFGDLNFQSLAAMADKKYLGASSPGSPSPSGTSTTCNKTVLDNWGEPYATVAGCRDYFPLIYVDHSFGIAGNGRGQGILLVKGDVDLTGGFEFWGVLVTTGAVNMHGNGGHVNGVVMSLQQGQLNTDPDLMIGNSLVQYSGCAVRRAVSGLSASRAVPVKMHSWYDLTSAGASAGF